MPFDENGQFRLYRKPIVEIYVRHADGCPRAFTDEKSTHNPAEFKRDQSCRTCECPKWLRYSGDICTCAKPHRGRQHRLSAQTRSWRTAEGKRLELQEQLEGKSQLPASPAKEIGQTIQQQIDSFLRDKQTNGVGVDFIGALKSQLARFERFMASRGKFYPADISLQDVRDFRASWSGSWNLLKRSKAQTNYKSFIRYCCTGDHRTELLDAFPRIKNVKSEPHPFTTDEVKMLLAQIPKTFASNPEKIARLSAFVKAAISMGTAVIDLVKLERSALENVRNGVLTYVRQKTERTAKPRIDEALRGELLGVLNGNPRFVFWDGKYLLESAVKAWQDDVRQLFQDAGLYQKGELTHRFRDTAAAYWLGEGCTMTDIAAMLGDTTAIVEKHYADLAGKTKESHLAKLPARCWD